MAKIKKADAAVPAKTPVAEIASFGGLPAMNYSMSFKEYGTTGLRAFSGWLREEFLPELQGRQGARVYREMHDNSPIIGGILTAITSTMRKVTWRTIPADDTPDGQAAAEFADSLRDDMGETWEDAVVEGLSMLTYGYAPQEIVYKKRLGRNPGGDLAGSRYDDGLIGWRKLPIRGQDTVLKWFLGENGEIQGLTQQPYIGPIRNIPIEKLLLFRPSQHKNNPEGYSLLRNSYRAYHFVKRIEEQEAIMFERLNGVPIVRIPSMLRDAALAGDANAIAAVNEYKKIAINLRIDEQMGVVLPSDTWPGPNGPSSIYQYGLDLLTPGGGSGGGTSRVTNANETLTRHATNMMVSVLADFLELGHGSRGTQSLAVSKTDLFFQAIEGWLNSMAAVYNRYGLPRVWDLNGMNPDLMPTFQPDLAARMDLDVLSNFVLRLTQSGMALFPNRDLEAALLDAGGLPDIEDASLSDLNPGPDKTAPIDPATGQPILAETPVGKAIMRALARRLHKHGIPTPSKRKT